MGYPVLRTYQPLAHLIVALSYFALLKSVSLMTVFVWVRFLSVLLLPLTFFITARLLSFSWLTSAAAAMLAPLISSAGLFGLEYGSYLWAGSGLFTQAVAQHFFLLSSWIRLSRPAPRIGTRGRGNFSRLHVPGAFHLRLYGRAQFVPARIDPQSRDAGRIPHRPHGVHGSDRFRSGCVRAPAADVR